MTLTEVFSSIANAIRSKTGKTATIKPVDMATEIESIQTGSGGNPMQEYVNNNGGDGKPSCYYLFYYYKGTSLDNVLKSLDFSKVTDMSHMFNHCSKLTTIPQLDTSKVTNMKYMFYECSKLTSIPQLDVSNVTDMNYMFSSCYVLTSIPQLDTSKVTDMNNMFNHCSKLTTIPQLDTSKVTNMNNMFYSCNSLTSIPPLDTSKVTNMGYMFSSCYRLEKIDITKLASGTSRNNYFAGNGYSLKTLIIHTMDTIPELNSSAFYNCYHFYGTTDANYNPEGLKDGSIYVPDDKVEALKVATNWSTFADIIKPLSTYVEG